MPIKIDDPYFLIKLAGLMIVHPTFLEEQRDHIDPEWFKPKDLKGIVKAILKYYDTYHKTPGWKILLFWMKQEAASDTDYQLYKQTLKAIKLASKSEITYVYDHYLKFERFQSLCNSHLSAGKALQEDRIDEAEEIFSSATRRLSQRVKMLDFFANSYEIARHREVREIISTGLHNLDKAIGGGLAKKEVSVVVAPPNRGKTLFLINFGCAALKRGLTVFHFFFEQTEAIIARRYAACLGKVEFKQLHKQPKRVTFQLQQVAQSGGKLFIHDCTGGTTIGAMRTTVLRAAAKYSKHPDVVIIDYADKLVSDRKYDQRRHEITRIYDDLIGLSKELDCAIYTASQTNRQALSKQVITMADVDEAFDKCKTADTILCLCQTDDEKNRNDMRIFAAKVRNDESGKVAKCKVLYPQMRVVDGKEYLANKSKRF